MASQNTTAGASKSKTQLAAEHAQATGVSVYEAAKLFDVPSQGVYRYIKRVGSTPRCPCCNQLIKA